ncbi:dihydrofolate reductase family protein [Lactobacillus selangorensis]|nr:dihydrofolate reductase family protein [Lactobacillus selangorensis]
MKKVVLYIAQSLDGYIADKEGSINWFGGQGTAMIDDRTYFKFIKKIDTVIMGRHTYNQIVNESSPDSWAYQGMTSYVLTRKPRPDTDEIKFIQTDAAHLVNDLVEKGGKDIWVVGGATIVDELIKADLIDIYCIATMPIILGAGKRLFESETSEIPLRLVKSKTHDGIITSVYKRREEDDAD